MATVGTASGGCGAGGDRPEDADRELVGKAARYETIRAARAAAACFAPPVNSARKPRDRSWK
jgi:hypothetical protein